MGAATLLRQARRTRALTQRQLAAASKVSQPSIADLESGRHDPSVGHLDRLLRPLGYQVTVLPTRAGSAADAAEAITRHVRAGDEERAFRTVIQLSDDLTGEHGALRVALTVTPPPPTGSERYDALLGALIDHLLDAESLPRPEWLDTVPTLRETWIVDRFAAEDIEKRTPEAFRRRNIWIDPAELSSV